MTLVQAILVLAVLFIGAVVAVVISQARRRHLHLWMGSFLHQEAKRRLSGLRPDPSKPFHILLCIADHFEPASGNASPEVAEARVADWVRDYPRVLGEFRDSDGRPPRHTFFYPIEQYDPGHLDALAGLCRDGYGEVEVHLHHDRDTVENLTRTLLQSTRLLADRHGLLGRWPDGRPAYGFVHGNWALDNSRPDGRWCGVDNELEVLRATGCYADFTYPSAPHSTQPGKINSIYYACGRPNCSKSHHRGIDVGAGSPPSDGFMLIQGPLRLWWPKGRWLPRIENACIQRSQPPSSERLDQWIKAGIRVPSRPDWLFIKLHSHGATDGNRRMVLGAATIRFHEELARRAARDPRFRFHYVTAREMYNLAKAAEAGWKGTAEGARDFQVVAPPRPNNNRHRQTVCAEKSASTASPHFPDR